MIYQLIVFTSLSVILKQISSVCCIVHVALLICNVIYMELSYNYVVFPYSLTVM